MSKSMRPVTLSFVLLVAWSCGGSSAPDSSEAESSVATQVVGEPVPPTPAIAEVVAEWPEHAVQLLGVTRVSEGILEVRFAVVNRASEGAPTDIGRRLASDPGDQGTVADVHILEPEGRKKYFVLREVDGQPVCSRDVGMLGPGERVELWARFPAPAEDIAVVDVQVPGAPVFAAVALPPATTTGQ